MTTGLELRRQRDPSVVVSPDARGTLRVDAEHTWVLTGSAALVATAYEDLKDVARRDHPEVLHLEFGNHVGVFRVRGLGTIEVVSGKWDEHHFDTMLADVARIASALPFSAGSAGPLPYDRTLATRDDLLYHAFVYIRHILGPTAPREQRLLPALQAILASPHTREARELVHVAPDRLSRVDERTVLAVAAPRGSLVRVGGRSLPAALDGYLPERLPEHRHATTLDTPENRFVKAFLDQVLAVLARMRDIVGRNDAFAHRVAAECRELEARLTPTRRHPLWRDVGRMTHVPVGSTVLQRRRGYRDVLRHFVVLRLATRHLPISAHEARDLLEGKDIATLYEMWCYFQVVDVLRELLGAPEAVDDVATDDLEARVTREFEVRWSCGVRALYNATFKRSAAKSGRTTYSLPLRPDVVIVLPDGTVHVLDAKFKLQWLPDAEDDVDRARAKLDDIYKMHAYRDAIVSARSAWVLYPGTEQHAFTPEDGVAGLDGVGAVPLRPELHGGQALRELTATLLGTHASATRPSLSSALKPASPSQSSVQPHTPPCREQQPRCAPWHMHEGDRLPSQQRSPRLASRAAASLAASARFRCASSARSRAASTARCWSSRACS